jgi:class 3 adenylate cyclase
MVTVLFSDIQGFSKIAEQMNPEKLIDELDSFFFHFDSVADKYNIEKIKTIGDAYMCAGGIPYKNRTNPVEVVLAALEMQEYMKQLRSKNNNIWDLRIGIHTGAVIAGVVGHKRYSYDIWGDTVNTASRMESSGEAGKVNISGHTYELVKDFFICENRGKMPVKYKGDIDMYFVKGIRPELSVDLKVIPNKKFFLQLQTLRLHDLEEFIIEKLNNELPKNLYFHNAEFTKDIYTQVELIGRAEGASPEELLLLRTAALFLNIGFITNYSDYIHASKKFAREILPKFNYTEEQIKAITDLIHSTQRVFNLSNRLETILLDASLNYLGRVDFFENIMNRFREVKERTPNISEGEWFMQQQKLLEQFTFYTNTAKLLREVSVQEQIQKLRENGKLNQ